MKTKQELRGCLAAEKAQYLGTDKKKILQMRYTCHKRYCLWKALRDFRMAQYYNGRRISPESSRMERIAAKALFRYYDRKRNRSGAVAGVEIGLGSSVGEGLDLWHGSIVINGTLGDHCILHGNNVIGNKGKNGHTETPVIGSGADIGAGAILIGSIQIADDCKVGAGAVVTRSFVSPGSVLVGVPARAIEKKEEGVAAHG